MDERPYKVSEIFQDILNTYRICFLGTMSLHVPEVQRHFLSIPDGKDTAGITTSFPSENFGFSIKNTIRKMQADGSMPQQVLTAKSVNMLIQALAIASYELLKESLIQAGLWETLCGKSVMQFFYHIRNGCAHNNQFDFRYGVKQKAEWRGKEISPSLQGQTVIGDFLKGGDLFLLLEDISRLV